MRGLSSEALIRFIRGITRGARLAPAYPRFEEFLAMRDRLDPQRVFANDYLRRVLGD